MRSPAARIVLSLAVSLGVALAIASAATTPPERVPATPASASPLASPFAAGDAAANIALRRAGDRLVIRWVARRTGRLRALHVRVKFSEPGYGAGSSGVLRATTHPVRRDGRPRARVVLSEQRLIPALAANGGSIALAMPFPVRAGQELATVIRNAARRPGRDYFSVNFLYERRGVLGANGRNERRRGAGDAYYGLDPRELVGFSRDGGRSWRLPGGPYGPAGGRAFVPTYVQEFAGGTAEGQVYYWSAPISGTVTMVYRPSSRPWTITRVAAHSRGGRATVVLEVDGVRRAVAELSGRGYVTAPIGPVRVAPGAKVTLTTLAGGGGLSLPQLHADAVWARLARLGVGHPWYLQRAPETAVPLYALPPVPR